MSNLKDLVTQKSISELMELRRGIEMEQTNKVGGSKRVVWSEKAKKLALELVNVGVKPEQAISLAKKYSNGGVKEFKFVDGEFVGVNRYCGGHYLLTKYGVKCLIVERKECMSRRDRESMFRMMSGVKSKNKHAHGANIKLTSERMSKYYVDRTPIRLGRVI